MATKQILTKGPLSSDSRKAGGQVQTGDAAEQFMRLFLANQRRFLGLILSMVPNAADAEDLLQEMSGLMWQKYSQFQPGTDFAAWGLSFARNVSLNFNRRQRTAGKIVFSDELLALVGDEAMAVVETSDLRHEALRNCIGKLPAQARELIDLRYEPGGTPRAVAERMGRPLATIYKALERTQDALMRCIERTLAARGVS